MRQPYFVLYFIVLVVILAISASCGSSKSGGGTSSNTDYGHGVTYVGGAGAGGADANITSKTASYTPTPGNAIIASAYTCADSGCQNIPTTTLKISDNLNDPEPCFTPSPNSPFALSETSAGTQKLQEYIWVCANISPKVTSFTVTCSTPYACSYITLTVTEWKGLATSHVFDADGGAASSVRETSATLSTWSPTKYSNDLVYTFLDNTGDETMTPVAPHRTVLQFYPGNINTATLAANPGVQTASTTWTGKDDWYGAIVAIKSANSQPTP